MTLADLVGEIRRSIELRPRADGSVELIGRGRATDIVIPGVQMREAYAGNMALAREDLVAIVALAVLGVEHHVATYAVLALRYQWGTRHADAMDMLRALGVDVTMAE